MCVRVCSFVLLKQRIQYALFTLCLKMETSEKNYIYMMSAGNRVREKNV